MNKAHFRRLVVRVIEDMIIFAGIWVALIFVCVFFRLLFRILGVA